MIDKIKELSDKKMVLIGMALILIAIIFFLIASFAYEIASNIYIDFVYYSLSSMGFVFIAMAYKKKLQDK